MQGEPVKYILIQPIAGKPGADQFVLISPDGLFNYLNSTYSFVLILIAITAVFYLIYGGMVYLTTDIANKQKQGKEIIVRVITGLVFVFSVWLILNSINPNILKNNLTLGVINTVTGTTPTTTPTTPPPANTGPQCQDILSSELTSIQGSYQLKKDAAAQFNLMYAAAQKDGITLRITSAYRSPAHQLSVWNQNGCSLNRTPRCTGTTTAVPCALGGNGSNHSAGTAVDINIGCSPAGPCNTPTYNWLKTNGGRYGFNNALSNDLIHWSPSGR